MKQLAFIFILFSSVFSFGQTKEYKALLNKYYDGFPTISISDVKSKLYDKQVYILDTRERKEYDVSHIKHAVHVGYDHFSLSKVKFIPKNKEIIVYCSIGARSQTIGKKLKAAGYTNVRNMYGGLFHWSNESYPMVDKAGNKTSKIHGYSKEWGKWVNKGTVTY